MEEDPISHTIGHVLTPSFPELFVGFSNDEVDSEAIHEVTEWLGLVALGSPRVSSGDSIDSYLSRYTVPEGSSTSSSLRVIKWQGLIGAKWLTNLLISCMSISLHLLRLCREANSL